MIDCEIEDGGAKRIGEMLEKNESLMKINLSGECSTEHTFIFGCDIILFGGGCSHEESEYSLRVGY